MYYFFVGKIQLIKYSCKILRDFKSFKRLQKNIFDKKNFKKKDLKQIHIFKI